MDYLLLTNNLTKAIGKLDNLTNGSNFCFNLPIKFWNIDLPALTDGSNMFQNCTSLTNFNGVLPALKIGSTNSFSIGMFTNCKGLKSWDIPLPALTNGNFMFYGCTELKSWDIPLPAMTSGYCMFQGSGLIELKITSLPSLTYGNGTFVGCPFTIVTLDMPALTDGHNMFLSCPNLASFSGDLSSLKIGGNQYYDGMFQLCPNLTSFSSDLSALLDARGMFHKCKLDLASIQNIAATINDLAAQSKTGLITIGMSTDIKNLTETNQALSTIRNKGWTIAEQYN